MKRFGQHMLGLLAIGVVTISVPAKQMTLGPLDPGAELGGQWYNGTSGMAYLSVDNSGPNHGNNAFLIGNKTAGETNRADWRSQLFALGPAAGGAEGMTLSFTYKFPGKVNRGDNIAVFFRFFDETGTNFLGQHYIPLGSNSGDSEMTGYKTVTFTGLRAMKNATGIRLPKSARTATADIWITCNIFNPWTSGDALFDDFSVTTPKSFRLPAILISVTVLLGLTVAAAVLLHFRRKQQS